MSNIINVAIVLIAIFIGLAVACSWIQEQIAWILKQRGAMLYKGIFNLVACHDQLAKSIWDSSLVKAGKAAPSYVDARNFSLSLWQNVHTVLGSSDADKAGALVVNEPKAALQSIITRVEEFKPGQAPSTGNTQVDASLAGTELELKKTLVSLLNAAENDYDKLLVATDQWFDAQMDRVAGWYKRWAQWCLIGIAILVGLMSGVDTLDIGKQLYTSSATQTAADDIRAAMQRQGSTNADVVTALDKDLKGKLNLHLFHPHLNPLDPIFAALNESPAAAAAASSATPAPATPKPKITPKPSSAANPNAGTKTPDAATADPYVDPSPRWHLLGVIFTIIAVSLGAPFWFDLLKCIINVRMAGTRPDDVPAPTKTAASAANASPVVVNQVPANLVDTLAALAHSIGQSALAAGGAGGTAGAKTTVTPTGVPRPGQ